MILLNGAARKRIPKIVSHTRIPAAVQPIPREQVRAGVAKDPDQACRGSRVAHIKSCLGSCTVRDAWTVYVEYSQQTTGGEGMDRLPWFIVQGWLEAGGKLYNYVFCSVPCGFQVCAAEFKVAGFRLASTEWHTRLAVRRDIVSCYILHQNNIGANYCVSW